MTDAEWALRIRRTLGIRDADDVPEIDALINEAIRLNIRYPADWVSDRLKIKR